MTVTSILIAGDSLAAGSSNGYHTSMGGRGSWAEQFTEQLSELTGLTVISPGIQLIGQSAAFVAGGHTQWTKVGTWTKAASTDAWDKGPYGYSYTASAGTADVMTWTRPSIWRPVIGFAVLYVDYTSSGSWQYRIDGGTYVNHGQTTSNANALKMFYVNTPVTTTVDFRAYNGTGNAGICLVGIVPFFASPSSSTGLFVNDIAINGNRLNILMAASSGDRMAISDSVVLGTGSPLSLTPNSGSFMLHINDVSINNTTTWNNDLNAFFARTSALGEVGFISPWEANTATWPQANQTNYRAATSARSTALGAKFISFAGTWNAVGLVGFASLGPTAANYLWDLVHPSQLGHNEMTNRLVEFYLTKMNTNLVLSGPRYPVKSRPGPAAYAAGSPSRVYTCRLPLTVGGVAAA